MLIPFRSKAAGEFFMFDHHAQVLFGLMGRSYTPQGAISGLEAGAYAQALTAALAKPADVDSEASTQAGEAESTPVGIKQRAWPLLDMLNKAAAKQVDVVWGSAV